MERRAKEPGDRRLCPGRRARRRVTLTWYTAWLTRYAHDQQICKAFSCTVLTMPQCPSKADHAVGSPLQKISCLTNACEPMQVEAFLMLGMATSHSDGLVVEHFPTARELASAGARHWPCERARHPRMLPHVSLRMWEGCQFS